MQNFYEWLDRSSLDSFINNIKSFVLSNLREKDGVISVYFPKQASLLQVAHTVHEGIEKEDPHGKGGLAFKVISPDVQWKTKDIDNFKVGLKKNLQIISKELGLLFELETFLYLTEIRNLNPIGDKESFWVYNRKAHLEQAAIKKVGEALTKQLMDFLKVHARDMGEKLYRHAKQAGKCPKMEVEFLGGEGRMTTDRADLRIGCISYSLKFTSEAKVHIASLTHETAYALLGGKQDEKFKHDVDKYKHGYKAIKTYIVSEYDELAKNLSVEQFVDMLNYLISGTGDVVPAVSHYIRRKGSPGFSPAMQKDFIIQGNKLQPRPGAQLSVVATNGYVKILYKVPDGTSHGTFAQFDVWAEGVNVKMNNLASIGGRNY